MNQPNDLFAAFAPASTQQWQEAVAKFLKGKSLDTLTWSAEEHLHLAGLYRQENTIPTFSTNCNTAKSWNIAEWIPTSDTKLANQRAMEALNGGANELILELTPELADHLADVLEGIHLSMIRLSFVGELTNSQALKLAETLRDLAGQAPLQGSLQSKNDFSNIFNSTLKQYQPQFVYDTFSEADLAHPTVVGRLAQLLQKCYAKIVLLLEQGQPLSAIIAQMGVEFSIGNSYFIEIAKLRAFRKLWLAMLEGLGATTAQFPHIQGTTQSIFKEDMYFNMIVCTSQAMSATIGQVDTLLITPSTNWEKSTPLSRRIARNIHHLLQYESHFEQIVDAAAGSYYLENATQQLTEQAWAQFLQSANQ